MSIGARDEDGEPARLLSQGLPSCNVVKRRLPDDVRADGRRARSVQTSGPSATLLRIRSIGEPSPAALEGFAVDVLLPLLERHRGELKPVSANDAAHEAVEPRPFLETPEPPVPGVAEALERFHPELDGSSGNEYVRRLLWAISYCASQRLVMPQWLHDAWMARVRPWMSYEVGSLDESFRVRRVPAKRLAGWRARLKLRDALVMELAGQHEVDRKRLRAVAKELNKSLATVERIWYGIPPDVRAALTGSTSKSPKILRKVPK